MKSSPAQSGERADCVEFQFAYFSLFFVGCDELFHADTRLSNGTFQRPDGKLFMPWNDASFLYRGEERRDCLSAVPDGTLKS
jgi:hypothetical protein